MAAAGEQRLCRSPSPETTPTLAIGACPDLARCLSTASSASHGSNTDLSFQCSQASDLPSRHSSASYQSDVSMLSGPVAPGSERKSRRRGYMRPQATDFAASARCRESVMSLGSIAHLQYYFARTGLLDGKGGQLARKKTQRATLDLSVLGGSVQADADSSYAFMSSSSPDLGADGSRLVASPLGIHDNDEDNDDLYDDGFAESEPAMLPPTVSTYHHRVPQVPKLPTMPELKADLLASVRDAGAALDEAKQRKAGTFQPPVHAPQYADMPEENSAGWYELQGMQLLDLVTLAIRTAKMYYMAHELSERLYAIKPEKQVRADLLGVMEVLKQMATRGFRQGMHDDEIATIDRWLRSVLDMLERDEQLEVADRAERANWIWLRGDWSGRELERERAFLLFMDPEAGALPPWTPAASSPVLPTPFLRAMQDGLRLVRLHNAAVHKSRRRFGAIPAYHVDTLKPYRCADNLRYWVKAAELRFEVLLKFDALGVVYDSAPHVWADFEAAILKWCHHVREEIAGELDDH